MVKILVFNLLKQMGLMYEKWRNKKVLLCTNDETITPKSGVVFLVHPYDIVNSKNLVRTILE